MHFNSGRGNSQYRFIWLIKHHCCTNVHCHSSQLQTESAQSWRKSEKCWGKKSCELRNIWTIKTGRGEGAEENFWGLAVNVLHVTALMYCMLNACYMPRAVLWSFKNTLCRQLAWANVNIVNREKFRKSMVSYKKYSGNWNQPGTVALWDCAGRNDRNNLVHLEVSLVIPTDAAAGCELPTVRQC